jgi:hypothetical protein
VVWVAAMSGRLPGFSSRLIALAVATVSAAPALAAEHETFRLTYSAPDDARCPDEMSFHNLVAARLGYDPFDADRLSFVRIELTHDGGRLRGRAEMARSGAAPSSPRELYGDDDKCDALVEALATSLAIALDPGRALVPAPPPPGPAAPPEPTPVLPPAPARPAEPPRPDEPARASLFGAVGGVVSVAAAPTVTLGGNVALGFRIQGFSLEAEGRAETTPGSTTEPSGDPLEATIFSGGLVPCANVGAWSLCAFARLGVFQGEALDVVQPRLVSSVYASTGVRVGYAIALSRIFALRPALEGTLTITRTTLYVDNAGVWTAGPVAASLGLALIAKLM